MREQKRTSISSRVSPEAVHVAPATESHLAGSGHLHLRPRVSVPSPGRRDGVPGVAQKHVTRTRFEYQILQSLLTLGRKKRCFGPTWSLTLGYLGNLPGGYGSSPPAWRTALSQCPPACALAGWEELLQSLSHFVFRSSHPQLFSAVFRATLDEKGIE